ncbi:MAG: glycosyl hydrolase family 65 protein [Armatimonadota bacterium]|nr:glycosyl hydrolase family 65 protein [Armatimonadota bacterium]
MLIFVLLLMTTSSLAMSDTQAPSIPDDFPRFHVPGQEKPMDTLRRLFWQHYPGAGPKATLWDEWLSMASLWPAVDTGGTVDLFRQQWKQTLSARILDAEGYVATHQHASIAHPLGWPFPFWNQGRRVAGWHFSFKDTVGLPWRTEQLSTPEGWQTLRAESGGMTEEGWLLRLTGASASVTTPPCDISPYEAPFLQLRWKGKGIEEAQPYIEWATREAPDFSSERRFYFSPHTGETIHHEAIPLYRHPLWKGEVTRLRIGFGNPKPGGEVVIQAFFTQYDTRHNINAQAFIRGCANYFWWTRDLHFLRQNLQRMRLALRYLMTEHRALQEKVIDTPWVGHEGRSGIRYTPDGRKQMIHGSGIGNNYWDLLPFGAKDVYATIHYYDTLRVMAQIEQEVLRNPSWNMPRGAYAFDPQELLRHAEEVKAKGNRLFWNPKTRRFAPLDADGVMHDYGFTFLNLEAVAYDFATPDHARDILRWLSGERIVEGDTSQGKDIYFWRFAPRATTRRNIDYYLWAWGAPESIPFGDQVQDGGAVLGFSYYDLMARLKVRGADDAWGRLLEILRWYEEVEAAGGYRKYYDGSRPGTLQGGGTAGGLGLDMEFFESVLVPQVMLYGFLGFRPGGDGFAIDPKLPSGWSSLRIDRIRWQGYTLAMTVTPSAIRIEKEGEGDEAPLLRLPPGVWQATGKTADGRQRALKLQTVQPGLYRLEWQGLREVLLSR